MFSLRHHVTLTLVRRVRFTSDVNRITPTVTRYLTTAQPRSSPPTSQSITFMHAQQRAKQITNQFTKQTQRPYSSMSSNNNELQLGSVFDVKDKVALVTGGGSGIGLMITQ